MGCDIHVCAEIKVDGRWVLYSQPQINRWYDLFGKMANVRGDDIEPIVEPKGLPEDISEGASLEAKWWGSDGHTHSWFNSYQIVELFLWIDAKRYQEQESNLWEWESRGVGYLHGNSWGSWFLGNKDYPSDIEDIRWVFWFDN